MLRVVENPKKKRSGKGRKTLRRQKPVRRTRVHRSAKQAPARKRRVTRVRQNPQNKFVIKAVLQRSNRTYFFRASTKSFVPTKSEGTLFKSQALAHRMAESIVSKLPSNIKALSIENTN